LRYLWSLLAGLALAAVGWIVAVGVNNDLAGLVIAAGILAYAVVGSLVSKDREK